MHLQVFFIALLGVTFGAVKNGGGVDIWNVRKAKYRRFIKVINSWRSPLETEIDREM